MSKQLWISLAAALGLSACGDDGGAVTPIDAPAVDAPVETDGRPPPTRVDVTGEITGDTTWTNDHVYVLKTHVFVRGGTLTIQPGTTVLGDNGSSLVITTGARIDARGTAAAPIVMTSSQPPGSRLPGDWGGLVLLGLAPINVTGGTSQVEGFPAGTAGTQYGGGNAAHDCGRVEFTRIEFAGFELAPNNELNALTVGACGSATVLDHIQTHLGSDDGIEFFGGTANVKHLLVTQAQDDGVDWDFGWTGKAQFLIVQQSPFSNQGFESDNNNNANDATPRSRPTIYNATLVGSDRAPGGANQRQVGMHLRRGTGAHVYNSVIMSFADFPIDVDGAATVAQASATPSNLFVKNSIFFDNGNQMGWADPTDNDGGFDEGTYFKSDATNRQVDPRLTSALNLAAPQFRPGAQSPALMASNAATPPADGFFDASATFIGALGTGEDWTLGWTSYPAN